MDGQRQASECDNDPRSRAHIVLPTWDERSKSWDREWRLQDQLRACDLIKKCTAEILGNKNKIRASRSSPDEQDVRKSLRSQHVIWEEVCALKAVLSIKIVVPGYDLHQMARLNGIGAMKSDAKLRFEAEQNMKTVLETICTHIRFDGDKTWIIDIYASVHEEGFQEHYHNVRTKEATFYVRVPAWLYPAVETTWMPILEKGGIHSLRFSEVTIVYATSKRRDWNRGRQPCRPTYDGKEFPPEFGKVPQPFDGQVTNECLQEMETARMTMRPVIADVIPAHQNDREYLEDTFTYQAFKVLLERDPHKIIQVLMKMRCMSAGTHSTSIVTGKAEWTPTPLVSDEQANRAVQEGAIRSRLFRPCKITPDTAARFLRVPPGGYALTFEDDHMFQYQEVVNGPISHMSGVVAMSIVCTAEGLKVVDCNIYHDLDDWNNTVTAIDYLLFNQALLKTFDHGVTGIVDYMRMHMSHLYTLPVRTQQEALTDVNREVRNQRLATAAAQEVHDPWSPNVQEVTPPSDLSMGLSWSVVAPEEDTQNGGTQIGRASSSTGGRPMGTTVPEEPLPTPMHEACAISPEEIRAARVGTFIRATDV